MAAKTGLMHVVPASPRSSPSPVPSEVEMDEDDVFAGGGGEDKLAAAAGSGPVSARSRGTASGRSYTVSEASGAEDAEEEEDDDGDLPSAPPKSGGIDAGVGEGGEGPTPSPAGVPARQLGTLASISKLQAQLSALPKVNSPRKELPERAYSMRLSRSSAELVRSGAAAAAAAAKPASFGGVAEEEKADDIAAAADAEDKDGGGGGAPPKAAAAADAMSEPGTPRLRRGGSLRARTSRRRSSLAYGAAAGRGAAASPAPRFSLKRSLRRVRRALDAAAEKPADMDVEAVLDTLGAQWRQLDAAEAGAIDEAELVQRVWERLREDDDPAEAPSPLPDAARETVASVMEAACGGDVLTFFDFCNLRLAQYSLYVRPPRSAARRFSAERAAAWVERQLAAKVADRSSAELSALVGGISERWAVIDRPGNGAVTRAALRQFVWESLGGAVGGDAAAAGPVPDELPAEMAANVEQLMACSASGHSLTFWEFASLTLTAAGVDVAIRPL